MVELYKALYGLGKLDERDRELLSQSRLDSSGRTVMNHLEKIIQNINMKSCFLANPGVMELEKAQDPVTFRTKMNIYKDVLLNSGTPLHEKGGVIIVDLINNLYSFENLGNGEYNTTLMKLYNNTLLFFIGNIRIGEYTKNNRFEISCKNTDLVYLGDSEEITEKPNTSMIISKESSLPIEYMIWLKYIANIPLGDENKHIKKDPIEIVGVPTPRDSTAEKWYKSMIMNNIISPNE